MAKAKQNELIFLICLFAEFSSTRLKEDMNGCVLFNMGTFLLVLLMQRMQDTEIRQRTCKRLISLSQCDIDFTANEWPEQRAILCLLAFRGVGFISLCGRASKPAAAFVTNVEFSILSG